MTQRASSNTPHDPSIGATFQPASKTYWVDITEVVQDLLHAQDAEGAQHQTRDPQ
jgi:hypothetical protein